MQGNSTVIELLNEVLSAGLPAINQFFIHHKMLENWGYASLAGVKRLRAIEEMNHVEGLIERILFLDGTPNTQRLNPVKVGEDTIEMFEIDLALGLNAIARLNRGIHVAAQAADNGTRFLLEMILRKEEAGVDWLEAQLSLVEDMSSERYLAQMLEVEV